MALPNRPRVAWYEGMLLAPQHFQQSDRHHEHALASRLHAVTPYPWGVVEVTFDERSLAAGQCGIATFEGIFPEGLAVRFRDGDDIAPPVRAIGEKLGTTQQSLVVYLAIPKERAVGVNISTDPTARTRFRSRMRAVVDAASGTSELEVPFAHPNLSLLFDTDNRDDFDCLPIGELVRNTTGGFALHPTYVPPLLRVTGSAFVMGGIKRVVAAANTRRRAIAEERRQRDTVTIEYNATDITRFLLLNALDSYLPRLRYFSEIGDASAREAYLELVSLAGALCTLAANEDPSTFPDFVHTDLRSTFEPVFARLTVLLNTSLTERHVVLSLASREDGMHFGQIEDDRLVKDGVRWFLVVHSDFTERELVQNVPRLAKIASWDAIAPLLASAMQGSAIEHELRPPKEIPVKAGSVYFSLSLTDSYTATIRRDRKIAVYLPAPFDPSRVRIELCVVLPAS
jgi:type VI secretion system protein ImpJ